MKSFKIIALFTSSLIISTSYASAPNRESMEYVVNFAIENEQLKNQIKEMKKEREIEIERESRFKSQCTDCFEPLCTKCNNIGARTDICFYQRVSEPLSIATCQTDAELCTGRNKQNDYTKYCAPKSVSYYAAKLAASLTCLLPIEIVCCPFYAICNATCAETCLCLEKD